MQDDPIGELLLQDKGGNITSLGWKTSPRYHALLEREEHVIDTLTQ
jgi:hypothetical protein